VTVEVRSLPLRYEAYLDGKRVGELAYVRRENVVVALHTEVADAAAGQGVGGALARRLVDDAHAADRLIDPRCPFVAGWLKRHPEHADLVVSRH
jgi:predicted GNAT family acetyltransferase